MASLKYVLCVMVFVATLLVGGEAQSSSNSCSNELSNLNVCAPYVVPGATNATPNADCCTALDSVDQDCLCNTLRIASQLPSQCNLSPFNCGN